MFAMRYRSFRRPTRAHLAVAAALSMLVPALHAQGMAAAQSVLKEVVQGMPKGDKQEVRVFTASFKPGDRTVFHTHRFPVTVYVVDGSFTLELEGREPVVVESRPGVCRAAECEDDRLQPQCERASARGYLLHEPTSTAPCPRPDQVTIRQSRDVTGAYRRRRLARRRAAHRFAELRRAARRDAT